MPPVEQLPQTGPAGETWREIPHYDNMPEMVPYPVDEQTTGHRADILHAPVIYVTDFSQHPIIESPANSNTALALSVVKKKPMLLVKLVPEHIIESVIDSTARAIDAEVENPEDHVFVDIATGGGWYYEKLKEKIPGKILDSNHDTIKIPRTKDGVLVPPYIDKDYDTQKIRGKILWIIDDMGDGNLTTQLAVKRAYELGAKEVHVVILVNKLEGEEKEFVPEVDIVGIGVKGTFWIGGGGADYKDDIGRDSYAISVMMSYEEWKKSEEEKRIQRGLLARANQIKAFDSE